VTIAAKVVTLVEWTAQIAFYSWFNDWNPLYPFVQERTNTCLNAILQFQFTATALYPNHELPLSKDRCVKYFHNLLGENISQEFSVFIAMFGYYRNRDFLGRRLRWDVLYASKLKWLLHILPYVINFFFSPRPQSARTASEWIAFIGTYFLDNRSPDDTTNCLLAMTLILGVSIEPIQLLVPKKGESLQTCRRGGK